MGVRLRETRVLLTAGNVAGDDDPESLQRRLTTGPDDSQLVVGEWLRAHDHLEHVGAYLMIKIVQVDQSPARPLSNDALLDQLDERLLNRMLAS